MPRPAPTGSLTDYTREHFEAEGFAHDVYRRGEGPAVLVLTEMPGISPMVIGFADLVVGEGFTAVLPDLFGEAGRDPFGGGRLAGAAYIGGTIARSCVSREFSAFALGTASPSVRYLRALAAREHDRCGGPGVGVVGMCFTGGFALAMADDPRVLAPVLSQPSMPIPLSKRHAASVDCDDATLARVRDRCAREDLRVLGMRFEGDKFVPPERFATLRRALGGGFVGIELTQADGHPDDPAPFHHSVLTTSLVDEPGSPTRAARDEVLALFRRKLRPAA